MSWEMKRITINRAVPCHCAACRARWPAPVNATFLSRMKAAVSAASPGINPCFGFVSFCAMPVVGTLSTQPALPPVAL